MPCKYLDYDEAKYPTCSLEQCASGERFWLRPSPYEGAPTAVQFCKKRGRMNQMLACTRKDRAVCGDYEEANASLEARAGTTNNGGSSDE